MVSHIALRSIVCPSIFPMFSWVNQLVAKCRGGDAGKDAADAERLRAEKSWLATRPFITAEAAEVLGVKDEDMVKVFGTNENTTVKAWFVPLNSTLAGNMLYVPGPVPAEHGPSELARGIEEDGHKSMAAKLVVVVGIVQERIYLPYVGVDLLFRTALDRSVASDIKMVMQVKPVKYWLAAGGKCHFGTVVVWPLEDGGVEELFIATEGANPKKMYFGLTKELIEKVFSGENNLYDVDTRIAKATEWYMDYRRITYKGSINNRRVWLNSKPQKRLEVVRCHPRTDRDWMTIGEK